MNKTIYEKLGKAGVTLFEITTAKINITNAGVEPKVEEIKYDFTINDYDVPNIVKSLTDTELNELFEVRKNSDNTITINSYSKNYYGNYLHYSKDEFFNGGLSMVSETKEKADIEIRKCEELIKPLEMFCKENPRKRKEKNQLKDIQQKLSSWRRILLRCEAVC